MQKEFSQPATISDLQSIFVKEKEMAQEYHYRIDYLLHGAYKTLYVRAPGMTNAEAWHWASVDAGVGQIPKYRSDPVSKLSKPQAEKHGIANVEWTQS
ncbi:hypothetical protein PsgB076_13752 [Pseudomonas savastanoi pv. glycinea str. B076]|uniref:Uncharacterized protein n=2 Tax=Pseudomonas savastanoi pv. glycinea TaxID=318 RepID=A0A3M3IGD5_PSESG|nr:hypothetical protein PsgB076_13752 [Pseudomonas savastanoi pv. glycinea str. B076]EFW84720.1 hypothetical protein PsgRace4_17863 [Pseudomonas savastanoi pv. glycinea str. race 4]RMM97225.1 hypothetical protein ALQ67_00632 [Pseudomonas savastanoi pv. glycinea]RMM97339.1 hypothetical protein ALQ69_01933 [Pseudomonas savastanoi pv. glycinea]RMN32965.1 hypothetical protein ALQ66_02865 [Pseudomonas savastanoi pv. glycinea]